MPYALYSSSRCFSRSALMLSVSCCAQSEPEASAMMEEKASSPSAMALAAQASWLALLILFTRTEKKAKLPSAYAFSANTVNSGLFWEIQFTLAPKYAISLSA